MISRWTACAVALLGLCGCGPDVSDGGPPTFEQVYAEVFGPRGCDESSCHGSAVTWAPLSDVDEAYDSLTKDASLPACDLTKLVVPGDPEASLLFVRMSRTLDPDGECGSKMPVGTPGVDEAQEALVRAWIEGGAAR